MWVTVRLSRLIMDVRFAFFALHFTVGHWDIQRLQTEGARQDGV